MFTQARAYNRRLAASGQPVIGEASDPYGLVTPTAVDSKGSNSLTVENVHSIAQLPLTGGAARYRRRDRDCAFAPKHDCVIGRCDATL